ncbi:MAG TPA: hypothetical protein G4O03_01650 [Dehalococcoidia bacterium]|nr:hypothetical protein [Dehalococcoidia bacterium]
MPRHRSLTLKKFITAINDTDPGLVERYFLQLIPKEKLPPYLMIMHYDYVRHLLEGLEDERLRGTIYEDLRRINDIGEKAMGTLVRTTKRFGIETNQNEKPQALAMRLFLDHPEAFDYAWAWYCYYYSTSKISQHRIDCQGFSIDVDKLDAFKEEVRSFFSDLAKGEECRVSHYEEDNEVVILVAHGSYIRTVARWEGREIKIESFRPAYEDILLYDKTRSLLCIKATLDKDREQYIKSFTNAILANPALAESPNRDKVYTLRPLQDGTFSWDGNEHITSIIPLEARLKLRGSTEPVVEIRSKDLRRTFEDDLEGLDLASGELVYMKFRFTIEVEDKVEKITFIIAPPDVTDLAKKKHADIISAYLKENGVQLI